MKIELKKYHGLGNDYIVFDPNKNNIKLTRERVKLICNRNFGVGSDGILVGPIFNNNKIKVIILNPDGSEAEKSGNGVRIFAKYLWDNKYIKEDKFTLSTLGGDVEINYLSKSGDLIKVSMGKVTFWSDEIPVLGPRREVINEEMFFNSVGYKVSCLSIGNPHCVIPLKEISKELACKIGQYSEVAEYFPSRINTQLLKVIDRDNIQIEIFERGAGYTLASGSSSCAAAAVAYKLGMVNNKVNVHMPGGILQIEIQKDYNILMTGKVIYIGEIKLSKEFTNELLKIS
ncbi:MAG: diaminopimelate epimerase [Clostridiales bacterium]|nr:diaminopimelate epimerase [Clostridiales bacterium]